MIGLLLAMQLSSSNCMVMGPNMVHCDTMDMSAPPAVQYQSTDWGAVFAKVRENRRLKAVGQMLASGDCGGAEKYAVQRGDFDLVRNIRAYCTDTSIRPQQRVTATTVATADANGPRRVRARTPSGYCLDVPPDYSGTGAGNSPAITSAMPRCDQLAASAQAESLRRYRH